MTELIMPKKRLGDGHYDQKLIAKMVELSEADDYEEACKEWIATGEVYWGKDDIPNWWTTPGFCLCTHVVVYHFEVRNEKNGNMILVGSDHINSYQILKQISLSQNLAENMITDEMIEEWLKVRVAGMKKDAWWKKNGEHFTEMFNDIKDYDLRVNVNIHKWQFDSTYGMSRPVTTLRKRATGKQSDAEYKMASIVWRWNHPDNSRNQQSGRGYPNERLWTDLIIFHTFIEQHRETCEREDIMLVKAKAERDEIRSRELMRHEQVRLLRQQEENHRQYLFEEACAYYGFEPFSSEDGNNLWARNFLRDIRRRMIEGHNLTERQLGVLQDMFTTPATPGQLLALKRNGWTGKSITKMAASKLLSER